MMASQGWKVVQTHVPMIRFRKSGINRATTGAAVAAQVTGPGTSAQKSAGGASGPRVIALPTIDDFHLPPRYHRRPIDEKEIEYINRGGPE